MSIYEKNKILLHVNRCWGHELSEEAKKYNFLDYATLAAGVGDMILNNTILQNYYDDFEVVNGSDFDNETEKFKDIYQYYITNEHGATILQELTDELVYYSEKLDMYLWGIDHYGTAWDYVLTDVKIYKNEKEYEEV